MDIQVQQESKVPQHHCPRGAGICIFFHQREKDPKAMPSVLFLVPCRRHQPGPLRQQPRAARGSGHGCHGPTSATHTCGSGGSALCFGTTWSHGRKHPRLGENCGLWRPPSLRAGDTRATRPRGSSQASGKAAGVDGLASCVPRANACEACHPVTLSSKTIV